MTAMPSPQRDQFETDDQYYWALSDYYESDEGLENLLEAFKRGLENGTAKVGPEAAAAGRAMLLQSVGLPADSTIGTDELIQLCLSEDS